MNPKAYFISPSWKLRNRVCHKFITLLIIFSPISGYIPDYRCAIPQCENIENATFNPITNNLTVDNWMNLICDEDAIRSCKRIPITGLQ